MRVAAAGALLAGAARAGAQVSGAMPEQAGAAVERAWPVDPGDITGRDFAGVRLPTAGAEPGPISFSARTVTAWTEAPGVPGSGAAAAPVTRLLLEGDVRVRLGVHEFAAARAVAWVQSLSAVEADAPAGAYQVFVYFDRVGSARADAAVAVSADRLRVEAVLVADGPIGLHADLAKQGRPAPPDDALVREGERALAAYLRRIVRGAPLEPEGAADVRWEARRRREGALWPGESRPFDAELAGAGPDDLEGGLDGETVERADAPIFARSGILSFAAGSISVVADGEENVAQLTGGVVVEYWDRERARTLHVSAERAAVFLPPGELTSLSRLRVEEVRGIYLEGDVQATDGTYTVRAPRAYYDPQNNRAQLVDAVFWTYNEALQTTLYLRAKGVRQEASRRFVAERALLTNAAFFEPHLAIGATDVSLELRARRDGSVEPYVDARHMTLRLGPVPFFYWPVFRGDPTAIPIRDLRIGSSSETGLSVKTRWDTFSLLRVDRPDWLSSQTLIDYYEERGFGLGGGLQWDRADREGGVFGYMVPNDEGEDVLSTGARRERDGEFRGVILGEHRWALSQEWTLFAEGAYVSDETFVDAFFREWTETRREFTTQGTLRRLEANTALTVQGKTNLNDFTPNEYLLQAPGYTVDKLPEASYFRLSDDVLAGVAPGRLAYSSEYRAGLLQMNFVEPTLREMGYDTPERAESGFGLAPGDSLADALRARGFDDNGVARFDTRHELEAKLDAGPVVITPFLVGRVTAWDDRFEAFSPEEDDAARLWGSAGATASTSVQRVHDGVHSRLLDLHRLRHIVEPSVTVFTAGTTVDQEDLPVYDPAVESIAEGTAGSVVLDQTWQTQRGGPGRWRSVDVFTLRMGYTASTNDVERESPIGRFFRTRPERSNLGEFGFLDAGWQVSDAVLLGGRTTYDFRDDQPAASALGATIEHAPNFSTFAEVRFLNEQDSTFYTFGAAYELGSKYALSAYATYDANESQFQSITGELTRQFPVFLLGFGVQFDDISDETGVAFVFQPRDLRGRADRTAVRLRGLDQDNPDRTSMFEN